MASGGRGSLVYASDQNELATLAARCAASGNQGSTKIPACATLKAGTNDGATPILDRV
jgi:hypothetical protein